MNMIVPQSISATPNGTTRPQVRIVIVGHVDHGKSTLVGRLLHETGSLPEGKLEMLKAVSARRGMPFEWSFLLDALQTERDQGITIDTTQIRFRTGARDVVLIDAPGHAEFLRNMITGASQADGAVLIIDALEGVRDQTPRLRIGRVLEHRRRPVDGEAAHDHREQQGDVQPVRDPDERVMLEDDAHRTRRRRRPGGSRGFRVHGTSVILVENDLKKAGRAGARPGGERKGARTFSSGAEPCPRPGSRRSTDRRRRS